jgi:hypothetical protein|tara:strand:- start:719 stop:862 length:144 start_codon:yes stop_codon:yes gene_type:complete
MAKKRKLNSKNPKYLNKDKISNKDKEERRLECISDNKVKVYTIWTKK